MSDEERLLKMQTLVALHALLQGFYTIPTTINNLLRWGNALNKGATGYSLYEEMIKEYRETFYAVWPSVELEGG